MPEAASSTRPRSAVRDVCAYTSFVVGYRLVPVAEGAYPHWQDQCWAEPSIDEAAAHMVRLVDDPSLGRELGRRGGRHVRAQFGFRTVGLRDVRRFDAIALRAA